MATEPAWYNDHAALAALYRWLDERGDVDDAASFLEKPWKWEPERARMLAEEAGPAFMIEIDEGEGVSRCTFRSWSHEDACLNRVYMAVAKLGAGESFEGDGFTVTRVDAKPLPTTEQIVDVAGEIAEAWRA